jgi:FkbM family methyltransferase
MRHILRKIVPGKKSGKPFSRATVDDLYYCYRLLLQREPDEGGWNDWHKLITNHTVSIQMLVDGFLYSQEFRNLQEEAFRPVLVDLERWKMYVRRNDFFIGAVIAREKSYEPYVTAEIDRLLKPGDIFVDIGANIGYFTLLAAAVVGEEGHVYAFEPNPDNCELLERSIIENGFANISLFPNAVAEAEQSFNLDVGGTNSNGRIIDFSPQAVPGQYPPLLVEAVVLDKVLADVERINLIKIDIEGAEPRAWQGMRQLIARHRPTLVLEFSPDLIRVTSHVTGESFLDDILDHNYQIRILERTQARSSGPQSRQQIMDNHARSGLTHLDLVAYPI